MYLKIISELGNIDELPTIPNIVLKLNALIADPEIPLHDIADLIKEDQVLTTRVLKLVNSSYYGFSEKTSSLTQAIALIGVRETKNLVFTSKTFDIFSSCYKKLGSIFNILDLWKHSLGTAAIAKNIATLIKYPDTESLFISGLVHDIGKVVEIKCLTDYIPELFEMIEKESISISQSEYNLWNISHTEIGKTLLEMWDFPEMLIESVAYHHNPHLASKYATETAIIHLADCLCYEMGVGSGGNKIPPEIIKETWNTIGIDESEKEHIITLASNDITNLIPLIS